MIKSVGGNKKDRETTFLYQTARRLMQKIVDEEGIAFEYKLRTYNEKMSQWAKKTGNDIFKWKNQKTVADALICESIIEPKKF